MKNHLVMLTFAIISFCFIGEVCQSANEAAAPATRPERSGRDGLNGDWQVTVEFDGRSMESILSFSRGEDGSQTGRWISLWGINELKDVKFEDGQLSFTQVHQNRQGESITSKFTGTIADGKISGTITNDRGESRLHGQRSKRISRAVGSWEMKLKNAEKEFTSTLIITADKEDKLTAQCQQGKCDITDVNYERGKLTFKSKSNDPNCQGESKFEGTIQGDVLSGVFKSEKGETKAEAARLGASVIGNWDLEVTSDRGVRKQRLKVNADMSGLYGSVAIDKVNLQGSKVSFKIDQQFGDRKIEMSFEGKLDDSKLTGELTTSRGVQKVTGTKIIYRERNRDAR